MAARPPRESPKLTHESIAADLAAFFKRGGKVEIVPVEATG
jgi:hypothetical protein